MSIQESQKRLLLGPSLKTIIALSMLWNILYGSKLVGWKHHRILNQTVLSSILAQV